MTSESSHDVTDADVVSAVESFLRERADAGVQIAQAASKVSVREGVLNVIFDAALAGATQEALLAVQPFDTLADFVGTPLGWKTPEAAGLRSRVHTIATGMIDGTSGGTTSVATVYRRATGESL